MNAAMTNEMTHCLFCGAALDWQCCVRCGRSLAYMQRSSVFCRLRSAGARRSAPNQRTRRDSFAEFITYTIDGLNRVDPVSNQFFAKLINALAHCIFA